MIVYSQQTTTLVPILHGISGLVRTGESQAVRNYMTILQLHRQRQAAEVELYAAVEHLHSQANRPNIYEPVVYPFTVCRGRWLRNLAAVHGVVDRKIGLAWQQEFRFVVVFQHEVDKVLRKEFKQKGAQ